MAGDSLGEGLADAMLEGAGDAWIETPPARDDDWQATAAAAAMTNRTTAGVRMRRREVGIRSSMQVLYDAGYIAERESGPWTSGESGLRVHPLFPPSHAGRRHVWPADPRAGPGTWCLVGQIDGLAVLFEHSHPARLVVRERVR